MVVIFFYEVITFLFFMLHAEKNSRKFLFYFFFLRATDNTGDKLKEIKKKKIRNEVYKIASVWVDFKNIIIFITSSQFLHVFFVSSYYANARFSNPTGIIYILFLFRAGTNYMTPFSYILFMLFFCSNVLICIKYVILFEFMGWKLF